MQNKLNFFLSILYLNLGFISTNVTSESEPQIYNLPKFVNRIGTNTIEQITQCVDFPQWCRILENYEMIKAKPMDLRLHLDKGGFKRRLEVNDQIQILSWWLISIWISIYIKFVSFDGFDPSYVLYQL